MASHADGTFPVDGPSVASKRRKLRKGTRSCTECKRRKSRCIFASPLDTACIGCQRRVVTCVGQEYLESEAVSPTDNRILRVEALIQQLITAPASAASQAVRTPRGLPLDHLETQAAESCSASSADPATAPRFQSTSGLDNEIISASAGLLTPESWSSPSPFVPGPTLGYSELSLGLYKALPSRGDLQILLQATNHIALYFYQVNTRTQTQLEHEGLGYGGDLGEPPSPDSHPVLLARHMLILSSLLQQLRAEDVPETTEKPQEIMHRLALAAISLTATREELLTSMEALQCIILEGVYQSNCGNLRSAWLAFRKALTLGQMLGIDRPKPTPLPTLDATTNMDPSFVWFRIVYMDRFLSLMLGLTQGTNDISMAAGSAFAQDTPIGKLQRVHAAVLGRILSRNRDDLFSSECYITTKDIDNQLLTAARAVPDNFWLSADFLSSPGDRTSAFWDAMRFTDQLVHYNLMSQLHLPYLLVSRPAPQFEYSRVGCISASREILARFISFSNFQQSAFYCRRIDFFAMIASVTLLLAHLKSHQTTNDVSFLSHQRNSDRAVTHRVLGNMERLGLPMNDALNWKAVTLLRSLLRIEADAAGGRRYSVESVQDTEEFVEDANTLLIQIPYFGTIRITPHPLSSENPSVRDPTALSPHKSSSNKHSELGVMPDCGSQFAIINEEGNGTTDVHQGAGEEPYIDTFDVTENQDWGIEGLDVAFFESLAGGTGMRV
ncbi:putative Zn(2)-C6 fungal-type domain-containing protein [Seiridium unicorne]|uniref:Zn(2)-C6 fungal-type domain-containing protein n=1 Tax=Seiridium unicorne TaxID=138068 RepID=A0ABR2VEK6_9PEZI